MNTMDISHVASLLRPVSSEVFNGRGKLCLSAIYLNKLNCAFDTNINEDLNLSFHIVQTSNAKANLIRDLQFLLDLVQRTISLKIIPDVNDEFNNVNITRFKNIKVLEIHKLDIQNVLGIQKLRSQLQELTCCHSLSCLSDILDKCGGDNSQRYSWNELKKANFSHNRIVELESFDCTLSLNTLDLSHNQLKKILVLNNNFIEDLTGLTALLHLVQLDLSQNCLLDHKMLLSISHLPCLQWLNLQGNPVSFHPHHRSITCNYLNKNSSTLKFVLDNVPLNKTEKTLTGSLYPIFQSCIQSASSNNSSDESTNGSIQERTRKIRNVTIEDDSTVKEEKMSIATPTVSSQHLEIKKQMEHLREEYGESWLYRRSGLLVQDVLGFEKTSVLSSTPYESAIDTYLPNNGQIDTIYDSTQFTTAEGSSALNPSTSNEENFDTIDDSTIFSNTVQEQDDISDASDGEDICSGGEESIYLATNKNESDQVFVVITETHISERDVTTSKEKARWHINTIIGCEKFDNNQDIIKIEFDTLRRDRKQRIYELDPGESETFYNSIQEKINTVQKPVEKKKMYQCMKCSELFPERNKNALLDGPSVTCPNCKSNLVVESV
ncbi:hypothetical protein NQ314_013439 [Rhamnusium bicolor]|uniref:LKB1 serine/threonine kinase interacting protein 1 N-terminal domain-containing protein n=1 Tax=Rhamnusium bicolor TaxID=1586634 RepID=A0AAV8X778_9CUCU|nr:hypothetical protein NQ314_013439 [Rhamnusium bicolor]